VGRILAIDFGLKRTGIAVTDPERIIARALQTVPTHEALSFLKKYCTDEKVDCIIVGMPKKTDGSDSEISSHVKQFINQLKKNIAGIDVKEEDERFTSVIAQRSLIYSGVKKMKRRDKSLVDMTSAAILLQGYLERIK
jgi:putative holliday junction resolvase